MVRGICFRCTGSNSIFAGHRLADSKLFSKEPRFRRLRVTPATSASSPLADATAVECVRRSSNSWMLGTVDRRRGAYSCRYTPLLSEGFFSVCFIFDLGGGLTRPRGPPGRCSRHGRFRGAFDSPSHYNYYNGTFNLTPRVD